MMHVPNGQIGAHACRKGSRICKTKRFRRMFGGSRQGLLRRHAKQGAGHVHRQQQGGKGDEPGLQSVATAIATPFARNASIGGNCDSRNV